MDYLALFTNTQTPEFTSAVVDGGKGHNLIKMKKAGLNVPSGLVISTGTCNEYRKLNTVGQRREFMVGLMVEVAEGLESVFKDSPHRLVSIRSGAQISMAGMMDTVLNVGIGYAGSGLNNNDLELDCKKRFTDMFVDVVLGNKTKLTDKQRDTYYSSIMHHNKTILDVISMSIEAVFNSWDNERAKHYRKMYNISDDLGTAVVIQSMVFGNLNDESCSGVMFTRNPNTGADTYMGEYLVNCQGEDVVAGTSTPLPLSEMVAWNKEVLTELLEVARDLEKKNKDMQDIEFTVQDGELFILQTRSGKRSALAEVVIARDLLDEGLITNLNERIHKGTILSLAQPSLPADFTEKPIATGIASGGYLATGKACYSVASVLESSEPCILIAEETTPEDIKGMEKAVGILTTKGGATSHAAVVARGMNKPCVVGCPDVDYLITDEPDGYVMINGQTGEVWTSLYKFEVDLSKSIPTKELSVMITECVDENDWITVSSRDEAIDLEDYLYNIVVPVDGMTFEDVNSLSTRFNNVVLICTDREDSTSQFLGSMESETQTVLRDMDLEVYKSDIENVYLMGSGNFLCTEIVDFKTMADVMNPDFIGSITPEFVDTVMGDIETYEMISEQIGMEFRVFSDNSILDVLEKWVEVG